MQNEAVLTCIDVFEDDKHPVNYLVDIFSGRFVDDAAVNSGEVGTSQWLDMQWPAGFHKKLTKHVKTMTAATRQTIYLATM